MTDINTKPPQAGAASGDLRTEILRQRYLLRNESGTSIETPRQMLTRVADAIAAVEANYGGSPSAVRAVADRFLQIMQAGWFLPNSPTLMNAGRHNGMLIACFVIGIEDSVEGIFEAVKRAALVQKAGGGTGFAFDTLRPTGDLVRSSGGFTSGPMSFWRVFAEATNAIQQGAHRRGANMGVMSIDHPDILKFIIAKQDPTAFTNFNISVKVPDSFMDLLKHRPDTPHTVINPRTGKGYWLPKDLDLRTYGLQHLAESGRSEKPCFTVSDLWRIIVISAHRTGEPGVCFITQVNRDNPTPLLGLIIALNACGEQPLLIWEACNLGSINVSRFVTRDRKEIDWLALGDAVGWAVRFLDDVVDASHYPVPEIQKATLGNRKIGLGIMGLADALILQGIRYDSEEGLAFASKLMAFIQDRAHAASEDLAKERGKFPNWSGSLWDTQHHRAMRNATCTTIAPTGSISIIGGCSSGIEPLFKLAYHRTALENQQFVQVHPLLEDLGRREGWLNERIAGMLLEGIPAKEIPGIPDAIKGALVTAHEIAPEWHVRMQAAIQQNIDNAVSKTVNLPSSATVEDVDKVYRTAHELGCKGITVYRDGSRSGQTLSSAEPLKAQAVSLNGPRPRCRVTTGSTLKFRTACGTLFATVNRDEEGLREVFVNVNKGGCPSQSEATCRAISAALRCGVNPRVMIEQLRGIPCLATCVARKDRKEIDVLSCPDAIAKALEEAMGGATAAAHSLPGTGHPVCPWCHKPMQRDSSCWRCVCGYSDCNHLHLFALTEHGRGPK